MVVLATLVINKHLLNDLNDHQWLNDLNYLMRDDATNNSTLLLALIQLKSLILSIDNYYYFHIFQYILVRHLMLDWKT